MPQSSSILRMPTVRPRAAPMSGWVTVCFPGDCGPRQEVAQSSGLSGHGNSVDMRVGRQACLHHCWFSSPCVRRGACPGFGGSDLEKECESGWGGVPASSAQAVGTGCQAAAAVAATQSSVPVALSQKLGEGVCASSIQNGTVAPSNHLAGETQLAWFPY